MNWKLVLIAGVIVIGFVYYFFLRVPPQLEENFSGFDEINSFFLEKGVSIKGFDDEKINDLAGLNNSQINELLNELRIFKRQIPESKYENKQALDKFSSALMELLEFVKANKELQPLNEGLSDLQPWDLCPNKNKLIQRTELSEKTIQFLDSFNSKYKEFASSQENAFTYLELKEIEFNSNPMKTGLELSKNVSNSLEEECD